MKILKRAALLCIAALMCFGGNASAKNQYWTWVNYSDTRDWDKYFQDITDVGITGILIGAGRDGLEKIIPIADKYGVDVHAWLWIMNNGGIAKEHPEWLEYNRNGESLKDKKAYVDYYKFLSPIIPGVREAIYKSMEDVAKTKGLKAISLDYCRFVDAILPEALWASYGIKQDKIYAEWDYGYHPEMIKAFKAKFGYDPREKEDPSVDEKWVQFRCDQVNEIANAIGEIAHKSGKKLSASPFPTPSMSRTMVLQDWGKWNLDQAFPMIYQGFYYGDAKWVGDCVKECVETKPNTEIFCGLHIPDFGGENPKVTLTQAMQAAIDNGAKGVAIYTFDALSAEKRAEMKEFISKNR